MACLVNEIVTVAKDTIPVAYSSEFSLHDLKSDYSDASNCVGHVIHFHKFALDLFNLRKGEAGFSLGSFYGYTVAMEYRSKTTGGLWAKAYDINPNPDNFDVLQGNHYSFDANGRSIIGRVRIETGPRTLRGFDHGIQVLVFS